MSSKKAEREMVKLQVLVEKETADKIAELAERMGASQSKMCQWLLEEGIRDSEWVIRVVTSRFSTAVRRAFGGGKGKRDPIRSKVGVGLQ